MSLAMVAGKLGTGALMDRFDHYLLFAAGCATMVAGPVLLLLGSGMAVVFVGYALLGLGLAPSCP